MSPKVAVAMTIVVLAALAIFAIPRLFGRPDGLVVDRAGLVMDTVAQGPFARTISAPGTLVSQDIRLVDATEPGVVERVYVKPGSSVAAGDAIAILANPDLQAAVVNARSAVDVGRSQLGSAQAEAKASALAQQSSLATAQGQMQEDVTNARSLDMLHRNGWVAESTYHIARIKEQQSLRQVDISRSQIDVDAAEQRAKISSAQAQLDGAVAFLAANLQQLSA